MESSDEGSLPGKSSSIKRLRRTEPSTSTDLITSIEWLKQVFDVEANKRVLKLDLKKQIFEHLNVVSNSAYELIRCKSNLESRLDEARISSSNLTNSFTTMITEKIVEIKTITDKYEQLLMSNAQLPSVSSVQDIEMNESNKATFAVVTRSRPKNKTITKTKEATRSKSRAIRAVSKIKVARETTPPPAFFITPPEGSTIIDVKNQLWSEVTKKTKTPKMQMITAKSGKLIIKAHDKESKDILRAMAKENTQLREESPLWPRVSIENVESHILPNEIAKGIAIQNPQLDINLDIADLVIKPIYKKGPRDRHVVIWVAEIDPKFYEKFLSGSIFLGFSRCRVKKCEDITQCLKCLKYGHPAKICLTKNQICAHCGKLGHTTKECLNLNLDPTCTNCKGKHSALDKTCSVRTTARANRILRTAKVINNE
jgi:hypothetical protein